MSELFELLDKGYRVYMTDVHLLLATMVWNRDAFGEKAHRLRDAIWNRKLISLNDLTSTAHGIRGIRSLLEKTAQIPDIEDLVRESESFERWLEKKWGEDMGQHLGAHIETLGRAAAACVTWMGTSIDQELLKSGLQQLQEKDEVHGLQTTLLSHYRQVYQSLRQDGRVHPVYVRQNTYRLGSLWPNIQNFSASGGDIASKRLVVASEGKKLVGYDVRMAELFALAQRWADIYPTDPKARTLLEELNNGMDLHMESGRQLVSPGAELTDGQIRDIGKVANFATLNMSRLDRINENLVGRNLPRVTRQRYAVLIENLHAKYPLRRWHSEAGFKGKEKRKLVTSYGRQIYVYRPQQYTGFQFQTLTGDAFGVAVLELSLAGYIPNLIIHDEAIIELEESADLEVVNEIYLRGFSKLLPETRPRTKISIYNNRWGSPLRILTV